jgi:ribosomal protein L3
MSNCKGLKGEQRKKCMSEYVKKSKSLFSKFDQGVDTVLTTSGKGSRSAIKSHNTTKAMNYNSSGPLFQKTITRSDGTISAHTITPKQ